MMVVSDVAAAGTSDVGVALAVAADWLFARSALVSWVAMQRSVRLVVLAAICACASALMPSTLFTVPGATLVVSAEISGAALLLQSTDRQSGYTFAIAAINGSALRSPRLYYHYLLERGTLNTTHLRLVTEWEQGTATIDCGLDGHALACNLTADGAPLEALVIAAQDYDVTLRSPQSASFVGDADGRRLDVALERGEMSGGGPRTLRLLGADLRVHLRLQSSNGRASAPYVVYAALFVLCSALIIGPRIAYLVRAAARTDHLFVT